MGPIRSPSGESARHEDAQKRLISATAAAQKRRVGGLAYESPAALRGWRSGEQAGTCSAVLGAAGESRERGRGWPPRAAKAKYRTILRRSERKAVSWLCGGRRRTGRGYTRVALVLQRTPRHRRTTTSSIRMTNKAGARDSARVHCPDSQALTATDNTERRRMPSAVIHKPGGISPREVQSFVWQRRPACLACLLYTSDAADE